MKEYISARGYRSIPVGYSAADVAENQYLMAEYMNCGTTDQRSDFYAINDYSWCDPSSFTTSGWDTLVANYTGYGIPLLYVFQIPIIEPHPLLTRMKHVRIRLYHQHPYILRSGCSLQHRNDWRLLRRSRVRVFRRGQRLRSRDHQRRGSNHRQRLQLPQIRVFQRNKPNRQRWCNDHLGRFNLPHGVLGVGCGK